eukprot:TRINITY_DN18348_c0_g1_i1.p1 TRINITY_DN18348_c0_g1~~TRINITY_DN18348_c0_g1_i1.p1  ORF type:complete len:553 (+),score=121.10 TRINITY_DN18348_c0_g1_i1:35-1660(+)
MAPMARAATICAWLRNDLRMHDSPVLHRAAELAKARNQPALPVYVLDPRQFQKSQYGAVKTGVFRALFLLQTLACLKRRLRKIGSDLLVVVGKPEDVLPPLLGKGSVVVTQQEVTSEELSVDKRLQTSFKEEVEWEYCWGSTLLHKDDLPFQKDLKDAPDVFTVFKNKAEPELAARVNEVPGSFKGEKKSQSDMNVRPCFPDPAPGSLPLPELQKDELEFEPTWKDLPYEEPQDPAWEHEGAAMKFEGGEDAALERLQFYLHDSNLISTYFDTRNGMLGPNYSTKFSPWLANGSLSPRKVFEQVREYEKTKIANKSTYWVLFELMWRDFFKFFGAKHGDAIFRLDGVAVKPQNWIKNEKLFMLWVEGKTGFPLVDANMREMAATGWMSNRGRQNVASFLVLDLKLDWRKGADYFESILLDYDCASNWGNWVHAAGLTWGRVNRFNVIRQAKVYDPDGDYLRHWLPELEKVPKELIHTPWKMSDMQKHEYGALDYPSPCIAPGKFAEDDFKGKGGKGGKGGSQEAKAKSEKKMTKRWKRQNS